MLRLAYRNLLHERTRLLISVGGVALSVLLILVMAGVFAGSERHAVSYIENQPGSLWLMQDGVENLHMSSSLVSPEVARVAARLEGVRAAVGLLYASGAVDLGETQVYSYVFAVPDGAAFGGPWDMASGTPEPAADEIVLDEQLAARYGLALGDTVHVLGQELRIAGLSRGTFGIATSLTFVNHATLANLMGLSQDAASYVMVETEPGSDRDSVADQLREALPGVNVLTRQEFIRSDQEMIRQMGVDIIRAMNLVSYIVGLLVIALTIYAATVERAREYGVLKAIGADTAALVRVVAAQAYISGGLGFAVGVPLAYAIGALVSWTLPEMLIVIEPQVLLRQAPILAAVTGLAAVLPLRRLARLDPVMVFKR